MVCTILTEPDWDAGIKRNAAGASTDRGPVPTGGRVGAIPTTAG